MPANQQLKIADFKIEDLQSTFFEELIVDLADKQSVIGNLKSWIHQNSAPKRRRRILVTVAQWSHPFPFRTRK